jgi:hypothetical protein
MNAFNRAFTLLVALAWIAAWATVIYLLWTPSRELNIDNRYIDFVFDLTASGADRILGTLIAGTAIALALAIMVFEALPLGYRGRGVERQTMPASDERYRELNQRLDELQRRVGDQDRRPVSPDEHVRVQETRRS